MPSNTRSDIKTKNKNVATHTQPENQERRETPLPPVTPNLLFTWVEKELVGFDGNDRSNTAKHATSNAEETLLLPKIRRMILVDLEWNHRGGKKETKVA
jgi:hypothetical protein